MAKKATSYTLKGLYDHASGLITEFAKDEEKTFSLSEILEEHDGLEISVSIKQDAEPRQADVDRDDVDDDED